ncbi:MAG: hypothetical protein LBU34_14455 [Planctomycetaceae bacterium]|nr:hypothetical protein [Planctomycetaceae bacterium]
MKTLKEQLDVSKQELETAKNQLTETQNELNETKEKFETVQKKTKELGSIIKKIPTESTSEEDQEKLRKWRVYGRNASAYQDYLEGKTGASKVPRPSFPEVFF